MGMIEIMGGERKGGLGKAFKDFKESLECLKEDFETLWDEMESMGERSGQGGSYGGGSRGGSYGNRYDEYDDEEMMGERRGVRGSGRGRRRR